MFAKAVTVRPRTAGKSRVNGESVMLELLALLYIRCIPLSIQLPTKTKVDSLVVDLQLSAPVGGAGQDALMA